MTDDHGLDAKLADLARQYDDVSAQLSTPEVLSDPDAAAPPRPRARPPGARRRRVPRAGRGARRSSPAPARCATGSPTRRSGRWPATRSASSRPARPRSSTTSAVSLLPRDPNDDRNVIVEIRAGRRRRGGGAVRHRAAADVQPLRAGAQVRDRPDERQRDRASAGIKEAILEVAGDGAYSRLKFEGGVHRVQRVPSHRVQRPDPHQHGDRDRDARGRRGRGRHRRGAGPPDRRQAQLRPRAASRSTPPTPRSGSRTCRPASSSRSRTRRASTRTRPRRCRCCARGCTTWSSPSSARRRRARRAGRWSAGGRPIGEDPDLQLPRQPGDRPSDRDHDPQRPRRPRGPARPADRRARHGGPGRSPPPPHGDRRWPSTRRPRQALRRPASSSPSSARSSRRPTSAPSRCSSRATCTC